jgi:hypothetical protein
VFFQASVIVIICYLTVKLQVVYQKVQKTINNPLLPRIIPIVTSGYVNTQGKILLEIITHYLLRLQANKPAQ